MESVWIDLNQACTSGCDFSFSPLQCHRHEIHKSHNKAAAHWELREKALKRRLRHAGSSPGLDHTSLTIIRDVCEINNLGFFFSFPHSFKHSSLEEW